MKQNLIALFIAITLLDSAVCCALNTPSSFPEVTIHGSTKDQIINTLTNQMLNKGYSLKKIEGPIIVFRKRMDNLFMIAIYGSNWNSVPEAEVSYTLIESAGGIRVIANIEMVTNPGTGFESRKDMSKEKGIERVQKYLDDLNATLSK